MRILVIGGTGFVGPHVLRCLAGRGHEIVAFHRGQTEADLPPEVVHLHGDREGIADHRPELRDSRAEVVLDTRPMTEGQARSVVEAVAELPAGWSRSAAEMSIVPMESCADRSRCGRGRADRGGRGIATAALALSWRVSPRKEDPMRWLDDYEKILVERVVMESRDLPGTVLRLPMVYGPGDDAHRLFPYVKRIDDGRDVILIEDARARWRWARGYVEDIAPGDRLGRARRPRRRTRL